MKIEIRKMSQINDAALSDHAKNKAFLKFERFRKHLKSVKIRIEDLNGPKGGVDKSCRLEITSIYGDKIVEVRDTDFYAAVDRALETAEYVIRKLVQKHVLRSRAIPQTLSI